VVIVERAKFQACLASGSMVRRPGEGSPGGGGAGSIRPTLT